MSHDPARGCSQGAPGPGPGRKDSGAVSEGTVQRRRVAPHGAGSEEGGLGGFCWLTQRDAGGLRWRRPWQLDSRDWPGDLEPACLGLGLTETQKRVMKVCMTVQSHCRLLFPTARDM